MVEAQDEGDEGEENESSDDELEAEYHEAVAVMTVAKQRRTEVDRARQFIRKLQSYRPSSTSSSRNFRVRNVGNWAIGKTMMIARPK